MSFFTNQIEAVLLHLRYKRDEGEVKTRGFLGLVDDPPAYRDCPPPPPQTGYATPSHGYGPPPPVLPPKPDYGYRPPRPDYPRPSRPDYRDVCLP